MPRTPISEKEQSVKRAATGKFERLPMTGRLVRNAVIAIYAAIMYGDRSQSRLHMAPGTSSACRPALEPRAEK